MKVIYTLLPLALAACGGGGSDGTVSGFASATSTGIANTLDPVQSSELLTLSGDVHMIAGQDGDTFVARAGIEPGYDVGAPAASNIGFISEWEVLGITDITTAPTNFGDGGLITLSADVGAGTVTGSSGNLTVNGTLDGGISLGGTVTYDGIDGTLQGFFGTGGTVGAFHGNDENNVYSGGFGDTLI